MIFNHQDTFTSTSINEIMVSILYEIDQENSNEFHLERYLHTHTTTYTHTHEIYG